MATEFPEGGTSALEDTQGEQIKEVKNQDTRNKRKYVASIRHGKY